MVLPLVYHIAKRFRDQWLAPRELRELQMKRLRRVIAYAYRRVPYYHTLFRAHGVTPDDIRSMQDLTRIPILTKEIGRENLEGLLARGVDGRRIEWRGTTGTTTSPMLVAKDAEYYRIAHALHMRMKLTFLEMPWDKTMHVTHPESRWGGSLVGESLGMFRGLHATFFRAVPLYRIHDLEKVTLSIKKFRPKVLQSHEFNLRMLSHYADELPASCPRVIHTGAGEVEDNSTRRMLEDAFGCGVYSMYGSTEFSALGFECKEQMGYHVHSDHVVVEYLRDGEQVESGEPGEMVVTDLSNKVMPFIRYQLGDMGVPAGETCPCGRGLPLLASVEGRVDDFVVLPDGRLLTTKLITSRLNAVRGMAIYRLTQKAVDRAAVEYVRSRLHTDRTTDEIYRVCKALLHDDVEVRVREVRQDILPQKIRPVVSEVAEKRILNLASTMYS